MSDLKAPFPIGRSGKSMPLYQCHKKVYALKIAAIEFLENGAAKIAPVESGFEAFETEPGYRSKFHGGEADLGYVVVYKDGYLSWSPSMAFEEGYTAIGAALPLSDANRKKVVFEFGERVEDKTSGTRWSVFSSTSKWTLLFIPGGMVTVAPTDSLEKVE